MRGAKTISRKLDKSGQHKRQATLILYIFADGLPCKDLYPNLIFYGIATEDRGKIKAQEKHLYKEGVTVYFNITVYNNEILILRWLDEELIPILQPS